MKAVIVERWGGPEVLKLADVPTPQPGKGEVLVRVKACALNHLDIWVRNGIPAYKIPLPHILGSDVAGVVEACGEGVTLAREGDRVAVAPGRSCRKCDACLAGHDNLCREFGVIGENAGPGGYAEYLVVPQEYLLPIPGGMSFDTAAAFPLTFLTAWHMLVGLAQIRKGSWVLVQGAGSGVGTAAIQICRHLGANCIAVSTSEEKLARAQELGAGHVVLIPRDDVAKTVRKVTDGAMCDVAFEHVGPATWDASLKSLKIGGALVTCGGTSGWEVKLDLRYVFSKQWRIMGSTMGTLEETHEVARLVAEGAFKPIVDRTFPLAEARAAQEYLAARKQFGKVLLVP